MNKNIAIISETSTNDYNIVRLKEEAEKRGFSATHIRYSELLLKFDEGKEAVLYKGKNILEEFDYYIFRSALKKDGTYFGFHSVFLKNYVEINGKKVLNQMLNKNYFTNYYSKISNYLVLAHFGVPVIKSYNCMNVNQLESIKEDIVFSTIVKSAKGSHGKGIELIKSYEELVEFFKNHPINLYLIQEYIPGYADRKEDFRVITLGDEVLGSYKKVAAPGSIVTNIGSGGDAVEHPLTPELIEIGQKIIKALNVEFTGIDIIYKDGKPYVLEVNNAPQFRGFETATKINLAGKIIDFLTK